MSVTAFQISPSNVAHAKQALNIGVIAASFAVFVSLSDFFFKPEQKKRIDIFIDGITLHLDYTRTLDWLQRWLRASRRTSIAAIVYAIITILLALVLLIVVEAAFWESAPWWELIVIGVVTLVVWLWQWSYVEKAYESVGVPIIDWLAESKSYGALIRGYLIVTIGGAMILALSMAALIGLAELTENWWGIVRPMIGLAGNFVLGMILCWIGIIIDGIATILGACIVFILRTLVDAARWTMWRISSYPKGALTATLTLIAAVLAVARILASK
jgi:hypothetical protein